MHGGKQSVRRGAIWLAAGGVGLACLVLYCATLAPGILGGDAGELQLAAPALSLTHPTGYPLHVLVGFAWSNLVQVGAYALRMNLLSAVFAALTVSGLCLTIYLSSASITGGVIGSLALGLSGIFWTQAISADKYALNALLLTIVLATFVHWLGAPREMSRLCTAAFAYGLSLTHHRSMLVFAPLLAGYWLWYARPILLSRRAIVVALSLVAPLTLYLALPLFESRGLPPGQWHPDTLSEWIAYLRDEHYLNQIQPLLDPANQLGTYAQTLFAQFGALGIALGVLGVFRQAARRSRLLPFLAIGFIAQVILSSGYDVFRNWVFFIPSFVLFAVWIGEGMALIVQGVRQATLPQPARRLTGVGLVVAALTLLAAHALPTFAQLRDDASNGGPLDLWRNDLKRGWQAQRFVENGLPLVEPGAIIFADWEQATPLWYAQMHMAMRPDVTVQFQIPRLTREIVSERPTYLARTLPTLGDTYHYTVDGTLLRLLERPNMMLPRDINPVDATWNDELQLAGFRSYQVDLSRGRVLPISLYFRALNRPSRDYAFSVRLFDQDGQQVAQEDRGAFALGTYRTSRWAPGEVVGDYIELALPTNTVRGVYRVGVLLYWQAPDGSFVNYAPSSGDPLFYFLPEVSIGPSETSASGVHGQR